MRIVLNSGYVEYLLNRQNKNKEWLAERVGVSQSHLSHWLAHKKAPCPPNRKKIMDVLRGRGVRWEKVFIMIPKDSKQCICSKCAKQLYDFE